MQPYRGGATYHCHRSDYMSKMERAVSGRKKGFVLCEKWRGVDMLSWVDPEFPKVKERQEWCMIISPKGSY